VTRGASTTLILLLGACKVTSTPVADAGGNLRVVDAAVPVDASSIPLAVDFTVSNCPSFEELPRCTGRAPLTLEFVPLGTASVTKYLWDFGDGTPKSSARAPVHTYAFPGTYDVSLVGGGVAGSAPRVHVGFVVVTSNGVGSFCDVDRQCDMALHCVCGSRDRAQCNPAFTRGLCAFPCRTAACQPQEVCADLTPPAGTTKTEPWQEEPLCVRSCQADHDCEPGLHCRDLPALTPAGGWVRGCFPAAPSPLGSSCRNAGGQLRYDACITGQCADLGTNGLCTLDCASAPCPPRSTCAALADGRNLCLPRCTVDFACNRDPLLACTEPNAGPLGFTLPAGATGSHCAPKVCNTHEDCGPAGSCRDDGNGAHCVRRVE
jgi:hypothetical protein